MSFFKKYNGTTNLRLARLETLVWVFVYGGLLTVLVGLSMFKSDEGAGGAMVIGGGLAAVVGIALLYLRSRLREEK